MLKKNPQIDLWSIGNSNFSQRYVLETSHGFNNSNLSARIKMLRIKQIVQVMARYDNVFICCVGIHVYIFTILICICLKHFPLIYSSWYRLYCIMYRGDIRTGRRMNPFDNYSYE